MKQLDLYQTTHLARSIVKEAGDQLNLDWKLAKETMKKDPRDLATQYDLIVEKQITTTLTKLFPDHSFYGEELTREQHQSDYAWYIDPIDGTKYFASEIPLFSVSLGLTFKEKPVLGVVYNPISNQMYSGFVGGQATLNYNEMKTSEKRPLNEAIVYADLSKFEQFGAEEQNLINERYFAITKKVYRVRAFGCGSLALCWIASGGFDAFIDFTGKTKVYDVCAGLAILEAAGGAHEYVSSNGDKRLLAASNKAMLAELKQMLEV